MCAIQKYTVRRSFTLLKTLFCVTDVVFITKPIHVMNGTFTYARDVFDSNKKLLGRISDDNFEKNIKYMLADAD